MKDEDNVTKSIYGIQYFQGATVSESATTNNFISTDPQ